MIDQMFSGAFQEDKENAERGSPAAIARESEVPLREMHDQERGIEIGSGFPSDDDIFEVRPGIGGKITFPQSALGGQESFAHKWHERRLHGNSDRWDSLQGD